MSTTAFAPRPLPAISVLERFREYALPLAAISVIFVMIVLHLAGNEGSRRPGSRSGGALDAGTEGPRERGEIRMLAGLNATNQSAGAKEGYGLEPRLVRAAQQFEALMMKELLAPMSRASLEDTEGEGTGILGEFASESLAGALSVKGGMGIADRIVHELSRSSVFSEASGRIRNK